MQAYCKESRSLTMLHNRYNLSKLLLLYVIVKLAAIVDPITDDNSRDSSNIVINVLDPCFCKTALASSLTGGLKAFFLVFQFLFARTAEEGSRLVVMAASAGRQTHGGYMRAGALQEYAPFITNEEGMKKSEYLWEQLSVKMEQLEPGITGNVNTS